jgi:hypothetical protein
MKETKSAPPSGEELLKKIGLVAGELPGRYVVEGQNRNGDGWIRIRQDYDAVQDLEEVERSEISSKLGVPVSDVAYFVVEGGYGANKYYDWLLKNLPTDEGYFINNFHGYIADVATFQSMLADGVDWLRASR